MKNYAFVDLHMHTIHSDEAECDMSVEHLLNKAQGLANSLDGRVCISITDHNSIEGVKEALKLIKENPNKYGRIDLIPGIEFTTDLVEFDQIYENKTFTRCHTLAYGFNPNDPELNAYSQITHFKNKEGDNIGMQICAARREINYKLYLDIPFTTYLPLLKLQDFSNLKQEFTNITLNYLQQNNLHTSKSKINDIVEIYLNNDLESRRKSQSRGRLKLSEIGKLMKNANGKLVIAHPSTINVKTERIPELAEKLGIDELKNYENPENNTEVRIGLIPNNKELYKDFIHSFEMIARQKVAGIEAYCPVNMLYGQTQTLTEVAQENGSFLTCGSDYHGLHLLEDKSLGNVLGVQYQKDFRKQLGSFSKGKQNYIYISNISGLAPLLKDKKLQTKDVEFIDLDSYKVEKDTFNKVKKRTQVILEEKREYGLNLRREENRRKLEDLRNSNFELINNQIKDMVKVATDLTSIIYEQDDPNTKAKMLLDLNNFTVQLYKSIKSVKKKIYLKEEYNNSKEYRTLKDLHKLVTKLYKELHVQHPEYLNMLLDDIQYYNKKSRFSVDKLVKFGMPNTKFNETDINNLNLPEATFEILKSKNKPKELTDQEALNELEVLSNQQDLNKQTVVQAQNNELTK